MIKFTKHAIERIKQDGIKQSYFRLGRRSAQSYLRLKKNIIVKSIKIFRSKRGGMLSKKY